MQELTLADIVKAGASEGVPPSELADALLNADHELNRADLERRTDSP